MTEALINWLENTPLAPLAELLAMGGTVMLVLLVMALVTLTAGLYAIFISILGSPRSTRQLEEGLSQWREGNHRAAQEQLADKRNPLAGVLTYTLRHRLTDVDEQHLREEVARRAQNMFTPFEPPLKTLEVIAALAPLLGLLGTVMGMMSAFSALAAAQGAADANQLSGGIYEALTTTAAGLVVAIPAAAMAAWLDFRMRRQQQKANDLLGRALSSAPQAQGPVLAGVTRKQEPATRLYEGSHAAG